MAKRLARYMLAGFIAFVIIVSFFNGSAVREQIIHHSPIRPAVVSNPNSKWASLPVNYPVKTYASMPAGLPKDIPKVQHEFGIEAEEAKTKRLARLQKVKESFQHAWTGYRENAWLSDEVRPVTGGQQNTFGGWAATLVDSLDTLWILGFRDEFYAAVNATNQIDFSKATLPKLNVFETTIRYMGGFLAAYDLSGSEELLEKAVELGEMIYASFDTPNRLPATRWNWEHKLGGLAQTAGQATLSAELGSMSLELTRLSQLTGDPKYFDAIQHVTDVFESQQDKTALPGMWPIVIDALTPDFTTHKGFSLGAMADSLYEYLPKEYMLLGGHADQYKRMYEKAIDAAKSKLFFRPMIPTEADVLMSGLYEADKTTEGGEGPMQLHPEGQHLVCFVGGMVAIAAKIFGRDEIGLARKLVDGCIWAYEGSPTGIMPEKFRVIPCEDPANCQWDEAKWHEQAQQRSGSREDPEINAAMNARLPKGIVAISDARYILRPEAIESIFILYRVTGDPELLEKGWKMYEAIEKATRTDVAHASLKDVTDTSNEKDDKMESFWTAETLKYLYLLFSEPSVMSLDEWVFSTEAHGFKRPTAQQT